MSGERKRRKGDLRELGESSNKNEILHYTPEMVESIIVNEDLSSISKMFAHGLHCEACQKIIVSEFNRLDKKLSRL